MFARFATLVFSLVVGITPIAPEACELFCASSMPAHSMAAADLHDGCGPQVSQRPGCCADADRAPAPASPAKVVINSPAAIARSISLQIVAPVASDVACRVSSSSRTPIPLTLRTPLRL